MTLILLTALLALLIALYIYFTIPLATSYLQHFSNRSLPKLYFLFVFFSRLFY